MASELYGQRVSEAGVKHTAHLEDKHSHAEDTSFGQGGGKTGVLLREFMEKYKIEGPSSSSSSSSSPCLSLRCYVSLSFVFRL